MTQQTIDNSTVIPGKLLQYTARLMLKHVKIFNEGYNIQK